MTTITTKYPFVGSIDTRQGGRGENQDNAGFIDTPLGLLLVVCDGMGGGPGGRTASLMAVDTILNVLSDVAEHTSKADALRYAITQANEVIYSKAKDTDELRGMGTTVAALIASEDSVVIAHVGDSRIYQLRKGNIVFRSKDHSYVANLVKQGHIDEEEARQHPRANVITRALGIRPTVEPEIDEVSFLCGDRFVLCTDGIWGAMPQDRLVQNLSRAMGIKELSALVASEVDQIGFQQGGNHDNLTLAIMDATFDSTIKPNRVLWEKNSFKIVFIILIALLLSFAVYFFMLRSDSKEEKKDNTNHERTQDDTIHVEDNVLYPQAAPLPSRKRNQNGQIHHSPNTQVSDINTDNPLMDQVRQDDPPFFSSDVQNAQVAYQIELISRSLDTIKIIKRSARSSASQRKKDYVKYYVIPRVEDLSQMVSNEKKQMINNIIKMIEEEKTCAVGRNGMSTRSSIIHIEKIKKKVMEL